MFLGSCELTTNSPHISFLKHKQNPPPNMNTTTVMPQGRLPCQSPPPKSATKRQVELDSLQREDEPALKRQCMSEKTVGDDSTTTTKTIPTPGKVYNYVPCTIHSFDTLKQYDEATSNGDFIIGAFPIEYIPTEGSKTSSTPPTYLQVTSTFVEVVVVDVDLSDFTPEELESGEGMLTLDCDTGAEVELIDTANDWLSGRTIISADTIEARNDDENTVGIFADAFWAGDELMLATVCRYPQEGYEQAEDKDLKMVRYIALNPRTTAVRVVKEFDSMPWSDLAKHRKEQMAEPTTIDTPLRKSTDGDTTYLYLPLEAPASEEESEEESK